MRIHLFRTLKAYAEPDTTAAALGEVAAGSYDVADTKKAYPTPSTDYVQISAPGLKGGTGWICSRWTRQVYAEVLPDALSVKESSLIAQLAGFSGFTYAKAYYPRPLPGVEVRPPPPKTSDCCAFVEAVVVGGFADDHADLAWGVQRHHQAMVLDPRDLFSSVTCYVQAGMATPSADADALPAPWTVLQGWHDLDPPAHGHNLLVIASDAASGKVLTLECNDAYNLNGPGFRELGGLDAFDGMHPGSDWAKSPKAPTWESYLEHTPHRRAAVLHVDDVSWVASGPKRWS